MTSDQQSRTDHGESIRVGFREAHALISKGFRPNQAPTRIGRYRITGVMGQGGMATVYRAEQDRTGLTVAVKVMSRALAGPRMIRRFQFETETLASLSHPGIAIIHDADTFHTDLGEMPFFAMEYIRGSSLTDHVVAQDVTTRGRVELLAKICDAVEHAHQHGVIHRDLKPSNILVPQDGNPKVIDFGVARSLEIDPNGAPLTMEGDQVGTLPYMSPEQVRSEGRIDTRSDVYALGVVAFELLIGELPYPCEHLSEYELRMAIADGKCRRLTSGGGEVPRDLAIIVTKAMEHSPDRRYQSASALADDFRRYLATEPISARPPSFVYAAKQFARRQTALVVSTVVVLLAILAAFSFTALEWREARESLKVLVFALSNRLDSLPEEDIHAYLEDLSSPFFQNLDDQPEVNAVVCDMIGRLHWRLENYATAADRFLEANVILQTVGSSRDVVNRARSLLMVAKMLRHLGEWERASDLAELGLSVHAAHPEMIGQGRYCHLHNVLGEIAMDKGELDRAEQIFRLAVDSSHPTDPYGRLEFQDNLGVCLTLLGRPAEAIEVLADTLAERVRRQPDGIERFRVSLHLGNAHALNGELDLAWQYVDEAATGLTQLDESNSLTLASQVALAHIEWRRGETTNAADLMGALPSFQAGELRKLDLGRVMKLQRVYELALAHVRGWLSGSEELTGLQSRLEEEVAILRDELQARRTVTRDPEE